MKRLTIRGTAISLGVFFDVSFVLCVLWGLAVPQFHAKGVPLLEAVIPGFTPEWVEAPFFANQPISQTVSLIGFMAFVWYAWWASHRGVKAAR